MKKLIFTLFCMSVLCACNNDDDNNGSGDQLNGEWNLVSVSCFCEPINLETGAHIWTFNISNNTLHVENNITEALHTIPDTGVYTISISENTITLLNADYDYYFENDTLYLADNPEADGPLIKFIRN